MKKVLVIFLALSIILLTGCEKVKGNYKEGLYFGSAVDNYGGGLNTATAVVYVDAKGTIKAVYLDTTYTKDGIVTTKKTLGDNYNMKSNPNATLEWHEQIKLLEDKVVKEQGIDFLKLNEDGKTDTVSGCTIKINALTEALTEAINKAK